MKTCAVLLALLSLSVAVVPQSEKLSPALASLVETERAFARTSVERGVRESFLAFFAEDGIGFQPAPVKTRASLLSRPAPSTRPPVTLNWFPVYGDVSAAGDLGYTTGPYIFTDDSPRPANTKEPPSYGYFFSIWRKQADGAWRVALDLGIPTPTLDVSPPQATATFYPARQTKWKPSRDKTDATVALAELRAAEKDFSMLSATVGARRAFARYDADDARFYRSGALPFIGAKAIGDYLSQHVAKFSWDVIDAGIAQSADFGYTYGSYELIPTAGKDDGKREKGYYARVWKRDAQGRWCVEMSVAHAAPPEQK